MSHSFFRLLAAGALCAVAAAPAFARAASAPVTVSDAWSRPAAAGMNGAGYMTLTNKGASAVALTGAETPLAASVSIHRTTVTDGVMRMRPVTGGTPIAPRATVKFEPGGLHLMLMGLKQPLIAGQRAPVTLIFADGTRLGVELEVRSTPPAADHAHHH